MRALLLTLAVLPAGPAAADDCSGYAAMIAAMTDAEVGPAIGPKFTLSHPNATNLSLECRDGQPANVAGSIKSSDPKAFLRLIATAAAAGLAINEGAIRPVIAECQIRGMRKPGELVEAIGARAKVRCFVSRGYEAFEVGPRP